MARPFGLRLVAPDEALAGVAPPEVERAARLARAGDATHRGLIALATHLARLGVGAAIAPAAQGPFLDLLARTQAFAAGAAEPAAVARARADAFAAGVAAERVTLEAITAAVAALPRKQHTLIDEHADGVVRRYAVLAAAHAAGAALLAADAVGEPAAAARVGQQVAGALAYQATGLGPARSQEVRAAACEHAEWERHRRGANPDHGVGGLAIQLFHEYLGAHWKDVSDAQRLALDAFSLWAVSRTLS